jgi:NAD(P)-dependent dehydrogenase (short-subunit alcohol dehydrogenase family)
MGSDHAGRLLGARIVVTGAARGIGAAIARRYADEGATLALIDLRADEVAATAAGLGAKSVAGDLSTAAAATAAFEEAIDTLGGVDVLVNNAGILRFAPLLEITADEWDEMFAVNTRSMLLGIQAAARTMIAEGTRGRIINMASMGGKVGAANQAHYAASKAAVISLTQVAAKELGPHGINVNCICPGYVLTEMGAATRTEEMVAGWSAMSPLGRCAEPDDVAGVAMFLASPESAYMTGQALNVTGGMMMQ